MHRCSSADNLLQASNHSPILTPNRPQTPNLLRKVLDCPSGKRNWQRQVKWHSAAFYNVDCMVWAHQWYVSLFRWLRCLCINQFISYITVTLFFVTIFQQRKKTILAVKCISIRKAFCSKWLTELRVAGTLNFAFLVNPWAQSLHRISLPCLIHQEKRETTNWTGCPPSPSQATRYSMCAVAIAVILCCWRTSDCPLSHQQTDLRTRADVATSWLWRYNANRIVVA